MRRVKGVVGTVRAPGPDSSSSMAFSSMESELFVDMLDRRIPNVVGLVGDVPDKPIVVTDSRRCGLFMAVETGPGKVAVPVEVELLRWKRFVNAAEVTELRRLRLVPSGGETLRVSLDMVLMMSRGGFEDWGILVRD